MPNSLPVPLRPADLRASCDPSGWSFQTVADLPDLAVPPGQEIALEALRFGVGIRHADYHLYAFAPAAEAKLGFLRDFLDQTATGQPTPDDVCYVNNFGNPQMPNVLSLPAGRGGQLREAMKGLVQELRAALPAVFESEDYRTRHQALLEKLKQKHEEAFGVLQRRAQKEQIAVIRTPMGIAFAPMRNGEVVASEDFEKLPSAERERVAAVIETFQKEMERIARQVPVWAREHRDELRELNRNVTRHAVGHLMEELRQSFADLPPVAIYLAAVERDVIDSADDFLGDQPRQDLAAGGIGDPGSAEHPAFRRYQVNLLVDNGAAAGAPVVYEDNPTVHSLVGRIEHIARFGALLTDFNLLRAGALHRANGGYLVLDALKLVRSPLAYEALKRALRSGEVRIQSLEQMLSLTGTVSPEAEPVRLQVKVVLIGPRILYYLLIQADPEFADLFKVQVDVEEQIDRGGGSDLLVARMLGTLVRRHRLRPLDRTGVARMLEQLSRDSGDSRKLSIETPAVLDLMRESDHWAGEAGHGVIAAEDVQRAVDTRLRRADRLYRRMREQVRNGVLQVETSGTRVGQVNGLSVFSLGGFNFGMASRITAQVRLGAGRVIDIEREVELGGHLHSKGVLILGGFLGGRFARDRPLSLQASLVFEQSYGPIDGDSASSAELYALLSAIAELPLRQDLAVTGSVDQHGRVQAIGGVNEKIEGFFDLCREQGLTGHQGVLVPAANVRHLMLREDVVEAAAAGRFAIYPVRSVDEGISLLTGLPAGEADEAGAYPEGTVNRAVSTRLEVMTRKALEFAHRPGGGGGGILGGEMTANRDGERK